MTSNIDRIFYINMDKRGDRRELIEKELEKYDLMHIAERFVGIPFEPGIVGCGKSHLAVMKLAKERGYKNVLILEDDFTFLVDKNTLEEKLCTFFEEVNRFDVCMFCCNVVRQNDCIEYPYLKRLVEASNASAYLINGHYLDTLIALYEEALPLLEQTGQHWIYANDQVWKRLQLNDIWYCFSPRLGKQLSGYSDNAQRFMDYDT